MKRWLCGLLIAVASLPLMPDKLFASAGNSERGTSLSTPNRDEVMKAVKRATELNEAFKRTSGKISLEERQKKRQELEEYSEEVLERSLMVCVELLSSGKDSDLAVAFFHLLISYVDCTP